ncbi:MAG: trypsin-like peptidase domain-containing protein [Pseudomonadota bacterium]
MKKLINFIIWPALAGLVFAITLLVVPRLAVRLPGLEGYFGQLNTQSTFASSAQLTYSQAIKKAAPAVVSINYKEEVIRTQDVYVNPFITEQEEYIAENNSIGSGVIISPDGFIITSYHVFFSPDTEKNYSPDTTITLNDGKDIEAHLVSLDEKNDLALLKIDVEDLPFLTPANSSELQVGNVVLAIGNPRNIGQSVSFGIISALPRREDSFVIQTDAAINPGNSGGALIDTNGKLIGINSTIVSQSGGSEGISFAIPAAKAMELLDQYLASGPSGYLGVSTEGLTLIEGQQIFGQDVQGFKVIKVTLNSPADKAGIRVNDIITRIHDTKIAITRNDDTDEDREQLKKEAMQFISVVSSLEPGALINIEVFRDGEFLQIPTILGIGEPQIYEVPEYPVEPVAQPAPVIN